jgi:hypothetical protein
VRKKAGRFQFFYASKERELPRPSVPVRDVTNTWHEGHKTEPHLERQMENWCPCRVKYVTPSVHAARRLTQAGGRHYMILTTRNPESRAPVAVGLLSFSEREYTKVVARFPKRWDKAKYLPYVGSKQSKLVSWQDAFDLTEWMGKTGTKYEPGCRCGSVNVPDNLLAQLLKHFRKKRDRSHLFLKNLKYLEQKLERSDRGEWQRYKQKINGTTRTARCGASC